MYLKAIIGGITALTIIIYSLSTAQAEMRYIREAYACSSEEQTRRITDAFEREENNLVSNYLYGSCYNLKNIRFKVVRMEPLYTEIKTLSGKMRGRLYVMTRYLIQPPTESTPLDLGSRYSVVGDWDYSWNGRKTGCVELKQDERGFIKAQGGFIYDGKPIATRFNIVGIGFKPDTSEHRSIYEYYYHIGKLDYTTLMEDFWDHISDHGFQYSAEPDFRRGALYITEDRNIIEGYVRPLRTGEDIQIQLKRSASCKYD